MVQAALWQGKERRKLPRIGVVCRSISSLVYKYSNRRHALLAAVAVLVRLGALAVVLGSIVLCGAELEHRRSGDQQPPVAQ